MRRPGARLWSAVALVYSCVWITKGSAELSATCSTLPEGIGCHIDKNVSIFEISTIDWKGFDMETLLVSFLMKSEFNTTKLKLYANVFFRLLNKPEFVEKVNGFIVSVKEENLNVSEAINWFKNDHEDELRKSHDHKLRFRLNKPLRAASEFELQNEFEADLYGVFKFDRFYSIAVELLPKGQNGFFYSLLQTPKWPKETNCSEPRNHDTTKLASRWISALQDLQLFPFRHAVNATFSVAPNELCISHYRIRVLVADTSVAVAIAVIKATDSHYLSHLFEGLPRGVPLIVDLAPNVTNTEGKCVCEVCNCITLNSRSFILEADGEESKDVQPNSVNFERSRFADSLWVFALILLGVIIVALALLISLVAFYHRKIVHTEKHIKLTLGRPHEPKPPLVSSVRGAVRKTILLLDKSRDPEEQGLTEKLANCLTRNNLRVRFQLWEKNKIEENIFKWISEVVTEADKIIMIHGSNPANAEDNSNQVETQLLSVIKPTDNRLIHMSWVHKPIDSPFVETVYILPQHKSHFCDALNINCDEAAWETLEHVFTKISSLEQTINSSNTEEIPLLDVEESQEMGNVAETVNTTLPSLPISRHSSLISMREISKHSAPVPDSAYGSMNTSEL